MTGPRSGSRRSWRQEGSRDVLVAVKGHSINLQRTLTKTKDRFELRCGTEGFLKIKDGRKRSRFPIYCYHADQPSPLPQQLGCHPGTRRDHLAVLQDAVGLFPFPAPFFGVMAIKLQPGMPGALSWGDLTKGLSTFSFYLPDFETLSAQAFSSLAKIHQRYY